MVRNGLIVAPDTGLLERFFSKLSKICHKDRNQLTTKQPKAFLFFVPVQRKWSELWESH